MREFLTRHRRFVVAALGVVIPLFVLFFHGRKNRPTSFLEKALIMVTAPPQEAAKNMLSGVEGFWRHYLYLVDVSQELDALRLENEALKAEALRRVVLEAENARLRSELQFKKARRDLKLVSAHVIGKELSSQGRVLRLAIDAGEEQEISENMPVVSADGLIGRIFRVAGSYAEVLLTVDARSVVNARLLEKGVLGTLTGTSSPYTYTARFSYLHKTAPLEIGDVIVSSGHDDLFPPGIPIGSIRSLDERQHGFEYEVQVTPSVNFSSLDEVQIVVGVTEEEALPMIPTNRGE